MVAQILTWVASCYLMVLTIRMVLSFFPLFIRGWRPHGVLLVIAEVVYSLTDPPLHFLRRFIKPLRLGNMGLDLAFMVLWIGVSMLPRFVAYLPI